MIRNATFFWVPAAMALSAALWLGLGRAHYHRELETIRPVEVVDVDLPATATAHFLDLRTEEGELRACIPKDAHFPGGLAPGMTFDVVFYEFTPFDGLSRPTGCEAAIFLMLFDRNGTRVRNQYGFSKGHFTRGPIPAPGLFLVLGCAMALIAALAHSADRAPRSAAVRDAEGATGGRFSAEQTTFCVSSLVAFGLMVLGFFNRLLVSPGYASPATALALALALAGTLWWWSIIRRVGKGLLPRPGNLDPGNARASLLLVPLGVSLFLYGALVRGIPAVAHPLLPKAAATLEVTVASKGARYHRRLCRGKLRLAEFPGFLQGELCGMEQEAWYQVVPGQALNIEGQQSWIAFRVNAVTLPAAGDGGSSTPRISTPARE